MRALLVIVAVLALAVGVAVSKDNTVSYTQGPDPYTVGCLRNLYTGCDMHNALYLQQACATKGLTGEGCQVQ